jgi:hypothetical protein
MIPFFRKIRKKMADDYTIFSEASKLLKFSIIFSLTLMISFVDTLSAQKLELPLHGDLKNASEKMKVKLGAKYMNGTFGIKIGDYKMARSKIKRKYADEDKFLGIPMENSHLSTFSTFLTSKTKDTAYIDVARNITKKETSEILLFNFFVVREYELLEDSSFSSVFIHTSLDKDEHWLLVLSTTGGYGYTASDTYLTNGETYITVKALASEPFGSILQSSAEGVEFYLNDKPIAAFQYASGGGMGYKQYVWISDQATPQQKLVLTATFAAILELMQGARVYYFD